MQKDIHHGGTYLLCRLAGMKSEYAEIVAYCAQHVDDADYGHALVFENGGAFKQTQTAYRKTNPDNFNINTAFDVLIPFHFLADINFYDDEKGLVTAPDSQVLEDLLEDILEKGDTEIGLYRLGIGLHCFEDVFAHQDFIGFYSDYNDVELTNGNNGNIFIDLFKDRVLIGHAPVAHNPDLPFQNWSYNRNDENKIINNIEDRFLPGLEKVYNYIVKFLNKHNQYAVENTSPEDFENFKQTLKELLSLEANVEMRWNNWLEKINSNELNLPGYDEIDENINYGDREWFKNAVEVLDESDNDLFNFIDESFKDEWQNKEDYKKLDGFEDSNWVKFMLAAQEHRYVVNRKMVGI